MTQPKTTVGLVFGGLSAEHEVSLVSARAIYKNIDATRFLPILIYIDKRGRYAVIDEKIFLKEDFSVPESHSFIPWANRSYREIDADIYFPILHGPNGEDGRIQGLFDMAGKPYVGANSFSSALAMDKAVTKTLFLNAGLKTPDFLVFTQYEPQTIRGLVSQRLRYPVFVKPCSLGSSVGISRVNDETQLDQALKLAFRYDRKILVEQGIDAREIEISVMGNENILISPPGELVPGNEFYDYADKYLDGKTVFHIPAQLGEETGQKIKDMAGKAFRALYLNGMSRIDFFLEKSSGEIFINEINTIPGFTEISMFPKLWQVIGISFTELIGRLIDYGFEYHQAGRRLSTDFKARD